MTVRIPWRSEPTNAVKFHDGLATRWDSRYRRGAFRSREANFERALRDRDIWGERWLDAGCGSGRQSRMLAARGCNVLGVDASVEMIRVARAADRGGEKCQQAQFAVLDLHSVESLGTFDGILCSSVLEYLAEPEEFVEACARCLRPGGALVISVPNRKSLLRRMLRHVHRSLRGLCGVEWPAYLRFSKNEYSGDEFSAVLHQHGFTVDARTVFGASLPGIPADWQCGGALYLFTATRRA